MYDGENANARRTYNKSYNFLSLQEHWQVKKDSCLLEIFTYMILLIASQTVSAQFREASPSEVGYDPEVLDQIHDRADLVYEAGLIPNYVIALARENKLFFTAARGNRTIGTDTPVGLNTLFPLASMSKPITSSAISLLIERGELSMGSSLAEFFPQFGSMLVAPNGSLASQFEPANAPITIEDLLTHRSGLTYRTQIAGTTEVADLYEDIGLTDACLSPDENMDLLSEIPLIAQPGTTWNYSVSLDVLSAVVGSVTGQRLGEFVYQNIFSPIGIEHSKWVHSQTDLDRDFATLYQPATPGMSAIGTMEGESINWQLIESDRYELCPVGSSSRKFDEGGSGLVGSAIDYLAYAAMIANSGEFNGARVLAEETVELQLRERLDISAFQTSETKRGFGIGFGIVYEKDNTTVDYLFWGGSNNTQFFIDPKTKTVGAIMSSCFRCRQSMIGDVKSIVDAAFL